MKKQLIAVMAILTVAISSLATPHNGFKYQAVVRNNQGTVIESSAVLLKASILQGSENGAMVYSEEHQVTTNAYGLINVIIGDGTNPSGNFASIDWAADSYFLKLEMAIGASTTLELLGVSPLLPVPYALHAETVTNNDDADADPTNELQQLSIINDSLAISKGNKVDLSAYKDNTDAQTLELTDSQLTIAGGNSVDLSTLHDADADPTNEIQDLNLAGSTLKITKNDNATEINLAPFTGTNTDEQTLSITGDSLAITNGNKVNLAPYKDNTDAQNLSLTGTNLTIEGGNTVDLSIIQDGVNDADADPTNEIQDLKLTGSTLKITKNTNATEINLAPFSGTNTDEQTLSLSGDSLGITNGNKVNLAPYKDNTDAQTLVLSGSQLSISGGNFVNLSTLQDADADPTNELQLLSIVNDSLAISKGNKVLLPKQDVLWDTAGTTLFYNQGKVGIGTGTPTGKLEVKGNSVSNPDEIIFGVLNNAGDTVFAVYQGGVRINVQDGNGKATGSRGGFAVGGISSSKGSTNREFMRVTPDSVRIYVNNDSTKSTGSRGGFAVGGISSSKTSASEYLRVTPDSVRIYVTDDPAKATGSRGGFAVGGISSSKSTYTNEYLRVSPDSVRIYLDDSPTKATGSRGGFAVGGISSSKGENANFFNISTDTTGIIDPSENRVLWYPIKNAFLVGRVLIESPDSVGENSMATGFESKAVGDYTQALGYKARAYGNNSTAMGNSANAVGHNSLALGNNAYAEDSLSYALGNFARTQKVGSYAIGSHAQALGISSFALGSVGINTDGSSTEPTIASGDYSYAFGMGSQATGRLSLAFGATNMATEEYSIAIGRENKSQGTHSIAFGKGNTSTANSSIAIGWDNFATGPASFALGSYTTASGIFSTAIGNATRATGLNATAMGFETTAIGDFSTAIGRKLWANGYNSIAMGFFNYANGEGSLALGNYTTASGEMSTVMGKNSIASATNSIAIGLYNTASGGSSLALGNYTTASGVFATTMGNSTKATGASSTALGSGIEARGTNTFGIGISMVSDVITDDNTMAIMGGEVGIGTVSPDKLLHVAGDIRVEGDIYYGTVSSTTKYAKPDFVFNTEYESYLEPLKVDEFIKANGHLPWMTSAKEEKDGLNLTRMQFETVETVENLQLQIINQQSEIEALKLQLDEIKALLKK